MIMFKQLTSAYNAGWRAGVCGTQYTKCPFRKYTLKSLVWNQGWILGTWDYLANKDDKNAA